MLKVTVMFVNNAQQAVEYVVTERGNVNVMDGVVFIHAVDKEAILPIASIFGIEIEEVPA